MGLLGGRVQGLELQLSAQLSPQITAHALRAAHNESHGGESGCCRPCQRKRVHQLPIGCWESLHQSTHGTSIPDRMGTAAELRTRTGNQWMWCELVTANVDNLRSHAGPRVGSRVSLRFFGFHVDPLGSYQARFQGERRRLHMTPMSLPIVDSLLTHVFFFLTSPE